MITPDVPPPPDFENLVGWVGGLVVLGIVIVGAVIRGIGIVRRIATAIRESVPDERPTTIVTADTVAMDRLAATIEKGNEISSTTNRLLEQLIGSVDDLARDFREDRQAGIRDLLSEQIEMLKQALKRPRAPRQPRPRKPVGG